MIRTAIPRLAGLGTAIIALAADQITKHIAANLLVVEGGHINLLGPVDLTLVYNHSNAFGLVPVYGGVTRWVLAAANLSVAAFLVGLLWQAISRPAIAIAIGLILAGAVGNAMDRLAYGFVVDFIDAGKIGFHWIFNVADASIDTGLALLLFTQLQSTEKPKTS